MSGDLAIRRADCPAELARYVDAAIASNSRRAIRSDWGGARGLARWCEAQGVSALPLSPVDCASYLRELHESGAAASTVDRHAASIAAVHRMAGLTSPTESELVRAVRRGLLRLGAPKRGKRPLRLGQLLTVLEAIRGDDLVDVRDRALLLVGWCAALRRSELVGIDWRDLEDSDRGYRLRIERSKTDQEGSGVFVPLHRRAGVWCPCRALDELAARAGRVGPVFLRCTRGGGGASPHVPLSPQAVWRVLRARLTAAGLPADEFGAHSLRSGLVVSARERGASERAIMAVTRHRTLAGLAPSLRLADTFSEDPAGVAGFS